MNEKIVHFPGATIPSIGEIPDIVEILEKALEQAKNGDLVAIGIVKVKRQPTAFAQHYHAEAGTAHSLAAGVLSLIHRLGADMNDDFE